MRDAFLRLWRSRGGGFYGLGYVVAFIVLEIKAYISSWESASDDIVGLVVQEVLQFVFRFAAQSMLNGFLALGWPVFVLDKLGGWGLALLAVSWWLFDRYARPWIAARLPEPPPRRGTHEATDARPDAEPPPLEASPSAPDGANDVTLKRDDAASQCDAVPPGARR